MQKMNPEIKAKWVADLRSGKFAQGRRILCQFGVKDEQPKFCCLGVLATQVGGKTPTVRDDSFTMFSSGGEYPLHHWQTVLEQQTHISLEAVSKCIRMNDEQGKTFSEIADWVEANL